MNLSDDELVRRIAQGDRRGMRVLYDRYADRLLRFALGRLQDHEEASDAVQETLIAAWESAASFREASSAGTWIFGICRNKVGESLRRRTAPRDPLEMAESLLIEPADGAAVHFWECLGRLSDEDSEVIMLVFHQGFSQHEVAEILGVPVGTVKSRTHYARRRLQDLLQEGE